MTTQGTTDGGKPVPNPHYSERRIYLYGVPIRDRLPAPSGAFLLIQGSRSLEAALIHGFSYQGHCYALDRPRIFLVPPTARGYASGCGFDGEYRRADPAYPGLQVVARYFMWEVDKLDAALQIELKHDTYEQLVLEASLPTSRQPASYRIAAAIGHRSGRLTE